LRFFQRILRRTPPFWATQTRALKETIQTQSNKNVLEACVLAVSADGLIQERQAELLRAIADTLDCPIPPFGLIA